MRKILTIFSSFILGLQINMYAEESNQSFVNDNEFINYKEDLKNYLDQQDFNWEYGDIIQSLVGYYTTSKNDNEKNAVVDALTVKDNSGYTFAHYIGGGDHYMPRINEDVLDILKVIDNDEHLIKILTENSNFIDYLGYENKIHTIEDIIDKLKDRPEVLKDILIQKNDEGNTYIVQFNSRGGFFRLNSDVLNQAIELLSQDHPEIFSALISQINDYGKSVAHLIPVKELFDEFGAGLYNDYEDILFSSIVDLVKIYQLTNYEPLKKNIALLLSQNNSRDFTFLHIAMIKKSYDTINKSLLIFEDRPEMLNELLMKTTRSNQTFLHLASNDDWSDEKEAFKSLMDRLNTIDGQILRDLIKMKNNNGETVKDLYTDFDWSSYGDE